MRNLLVLQLVVFMILAVGLSEGGKKPDRVQELKDRAYDNIIRLTAGARLQEILVEKKIIDKTYNVKKFLQPTYLKCSINSFKGNSKEEAIKRLEDAFQKWRTEGYDFNDSVEQFNEGPGSTSNHETLKVKGLLKTLLDLDI